MDLLIIAITDEAVDGVPTLRVHYDLINDDGDVIRSGTSDFHPHVVTPQDIIDQMRAEIYTQNPANATAASDPAIQALVDVKILTPSEWPFEPPRVKPGMGGPP